jgi:hypothetical protein
MASKAQRRGRKRKAEAVNLANEPTKHRNRYPSGKAKPEDARATALQARCRVDGIAPTKEALRDAESPLRGCSVGKRILTEAERHHPDLWNAVKHARQTQERFDRAIGAPPRHAKVASILAPVSAMEADASSPALDLRTPEERVRQDTAAQMRMEGWISHCDSAAVSAFKHAVLNAPNDPIRDWTGVLNCLWCIVEGLAGQKVSARVR